MNAVSAIPWLVANLFLIASARKAALRAFPRDDSYQLLLHVAALFAAVVTASATIVGVAGLLSGASLIATSSALALALALAGRAARGGVAPAGRTESAWVRRAWTVVAALWFADVLVRGLLEFTSTFDSLMYHIPLVDHWLQARSLHVPASFHWSNPGGAELLGLWAAAPFSGDFLVPLDNLPVTILLAFGTLELGRQLGLGVGPAHAAALVTVSGFTVWDQLGNAGNDIAVGGYFVACIAYGVRYARRGRLADLAFFSGLVGLTGGVKYFALGYAAIAWATTSWLVASRRGLAAGLLTAAAGLIGAGMMGGYWYVRNTLVSGSPFFPLGVTRGSDLLSKSYPDAWRSSFLGNGDPQIWPLGLEALWAMTGICQTTAVLLLPAVLACLLGVGVGLLRPRGLRGRRDLRLAAAFLLIGSAFVFAATPFALEDRPGTLNHLRWRYTPARYGLSFLSVAAVAAALAIQDIGLLRRTTAGRIAGVAFTLAVIWQAVASFLSIDESRAPDSLPSIAAIGAALALLSAPIRGSWNWSAVTPRRAIAVTVCAFAAASLGVQALGRSWHDGFAAHYDVAYSTRVLKALDASDPPVRNVCLLDYRVHPFFGASRERRIFQPMTVPSLDWLSGYLGERGVDAVVVRTRESRGAAGWDAYVGVGGWFAAPGSPFELVHQDREFSVYRPGAVARADAHAGSPTVRRDASPIF